MSIVRCLTGGMMDLERWRRVIVQHFGRQLRPRSKWHPLTLTILLVDSGLKPGVVLDYGASLTDKFPPFLTALHDQGLVENMLCVVHIGHTAILANPSSLTLKRNSIHKGSNHQGVDGLPLFVDISGHLPEPKLLDDVDKVSSSVEAFLEVCQHSQDSNNIVVKEDGSFNPCSLFGLLLGYPVVYWFCSPQPQRQSTVSRLEAQRERNACTDEDEDALKLNREDNECTGSDSEILEDAREPDSSTSSEHSTDVCLSWVPLRAYTVTAIVSEAFQDLKRKNSVQHSDGASSGGCCHEVYPFSCPEKLVAKVEKHVQLWFDEICLCASKTQYFSKLQLHVSIEKHAHVCL